MDSDTTTRVGDHARILDAFETEGDVLVGTQMVAEGARFPDRDAGGVVAADIGLHASRLSRGGAKFRADRAGLRAQRPRAARRGDRPDLFARSSRDRFAAQHDYDGFARSGAGGARRGGFSAVAAARVRRA